MNPPTKPAAAAAKRGRPAGANSKSAQIRELLNTGMSVADIAKKVGSSANLVYVVKSKGDGSGKRGPGRPRGTGAGTTKRGPGRPPKAAAGTNGLDGIVAAVRQGEQDRARMRTALRSRGLAGEGMSMAALARRFGISTATMRKIMGERLPSGRLRPQRTA